MNIASSIIFPDHDACQDDGDWLDAVASSLRTDRHAAAAVLGAVLRPLRDRLPFDRAAHLGECLPTCIRAACDGGGRRRGDEESWTTLAAYLRRVHEELRDVPPVRTRDAVRVVFDVLGYCADPREVTDAIHALPDGVRAHYLDQRDRWSAAPRTASVTNR